MIGKPVRLFSKAHFFRNRIERLAQNMRDLIREQVLMHPTISVEQLRSRLIFLHALTPVVNLRMAKVTPALCQSRVEKEGFEDYLFAHEVEFTFSGSSELLTAWRPGLPSYFGEGEIQNGGLTRIHALPTRSMVRLREMIEADLLTMRRYLSSQTQSIQSFNSWLERYVERCIEHYVEHIPLWRLEGELDRAAAAGRPVKRSKARVQVAA